MSDLEVTVRYRSVPAQIGLYTTMLLSPAWGIFAPIATVLYVFQSSVYGLQIVGLNSWSTLIGIVLGWILLFLAGACATICFADNRIRLSKQSLLLPLCLAVFTGVRRQIAWSEIAKIDLLDTDKPGQETVVIYPREGSSVVLKISRIKPDQLEQMLVAFDVWGGEAERTPALIGLQEQLQGKTDGEAPSYTAMWEDELASRFATTSFTPLEPDAILQGGRLKVIRQLSFGGLSAIYLCQIGNKELAVLKESVIPSGTKDEVRAKSLELFEREAKLLMKVRHQNIVQVLDHFVEGGRNYLLLEYVNGQDLRQFVRQNGARNEYTTLEWARQIAAILDYLHNQTPPVIHRDISPDNIVLREDESLTLIDFGAASEFVGNVTGTLVGKQSFIAPEQFRGKTVVQSDLYALGCTLFFFLTGQEPEALSTSHPKQLRPDLSTEIDDLVANLTAMEVEDRLQSAYEVQVRVEQLLQGLAALTPIS